VPDGLHAQQDQVCGTRPLHDGEYLRRSLHQRTDAKRDRDHLRIKAQLISGDAEQRGPPAHGQGPADGEQHARAGNGDEHGDQGGER
jgi:hypothetical protein